MVNNYSSAINLVSLDPGVNKQSLISFLQSQQVFKDYDFTGSDISILLDMLSVNTFRHAFYLNMAISEGFLDSAQLLNSVRSHAKDLNYCPRSVRGAQANVTVTFQATGESQPYTIQKGSTFSTYVKQQTFTFSVDETLTVASANSTFSFSTPISEGVYVKDSYIYNNTANTIQYFDISNANVDTDSIVVNVFENNSVVGQNFNLATSLLDLTSNSYVYFLQTSAINGQYQILFGDNIFGYQPQNGALVVLDYRISKGAPANGAGNFSINFDPTGAGELINGSANVFTSQQAIGGTASESIDTTRFYAPRWFQTQERCIVPSDYEVLLKQNFPEIQAVNAYGGETLTPPQYGKVVIAVDIANVNGLPTSKVSQYTSFIKGRNPISIQPIFVSPLFIFVAVTTDVKYNINVTTETDQRISSLVASAISSYNEENLDDFDVSFYLDNFVDAIKAADPSIISAPTTIQLYQNIFPSQTAANYNLIFNQILVSTYSPLPVSHPENIQKTLSSSSFYYKGNLSQLEDDGIGTIRIVNISGTTLTTAAEVGTINYQSGAVALTAFSVDSYQGSALSIYVKLAEDDFTTNQNTILSIDPSQVTITVDQLSS